MYELQPMVSGSGGRMNLANQIALITVPQEFARLCNAVLLAEHGSDFLPIDDDRPDRGNDGYLKSEKRLFAMHCFKRVQNQSLDREIRSKMMSDLAKAARLKGEGGWEIQKWTFICNYPIPESIGKEVILAGKRAEIDPSWLGSDYLAEVLQRVKSLKNSFPNLQVIDVMSQLQLIIAKLEIDSGEVDAEPINWVPRDRIEQEQLINQQPPAWEYLLFAGVLQQGKQSLELKWHDYKTGYARKRGVYLGEKDARAYLINIWADAQRIMAPIEPSFTEEAHVEIFGAPGEPGNASLIEHYARRILASYEELLDWAAEVRGTTYPEDFKWAFELAARAMQRPASDVRGFIDYSVKKIGEIPALLADSNSGPIEIELQLTVTIDDKAINAFNKELDNITKKRRS
jgi:hypothetical protein